MAKYCPRCNRSSDEVKFVGEFCEICYSEAQREKLPKRLEITRCKRCGKIKASGKFMAETDELLEKAMATQIKKCDVSLESVNDGKAKLFIRPKDTDASFEAEIEIKEKIVMCPVCTRVLGGYYEAVIQVRGDLEKSAKMSNRIESYFERNGGYVTKITEVFGGYDLYVSSKKMASGFISSMHLKPNISYTLAGLRNGKKVYRNTYAIHI